MHSLKRESLILANSLNFLDMLYASYSKYNLVFKTPAWTSRGVLTHKETYFVRIFDDAKPDQVGLGECALFRGLGCDDVAEYENILADLCWHIGDRIEDFRERYKDFPSIVFGIETAWADLQNGGKQRPFPSEFTQGKGSIRTNGLIWFGKIDDMLLQIRKKIDAGFTCIKLKIGAGEFDEEIDLLRKIRKTYSPSDIELRVDANGAFSEDEALQKLCRLSELKLHSIEQPIRAGQWDAMAKLCSESPLDIALDEEMIGVNNHADKVRLIETIHPKYIVLKPSLHGAFCGTSEWIEIAKSNNVAWWITSALESNVGLNAIAQWTFLQNVSMPQGLGLGSLYENNVPSYISLSGDRLMFDPKAKMF